MTPTPPAATSYFARPAVRVPVLLAVLAMALVACSSGIDETSLTASTTSSTTTTSTTTTTLPPTTTTTIPPTTTTEPLVTKGGVVKVANSSGVNGAAGLLTDELAAVGFETRKATNGAGPDGDLDVSKIYVVKGSEAVAKSVSRLMGGLEIVPMTTPAWITGATEELADATVLVMLGHDLAGKRLAQMAA